MQNQAQQDKCQNVKKQKQSSMFSKHTFDFSWSNNVCVQSFNVLSINNGLSDVKSTFVASLKDLMCFFFSLAIFFFLFRLLSKWFFCSSLLKLPKSHFFLPHPYLLGPLVFKTDSQSRQVLFSGLSSFVPSMWMAWLLLKQLNFCGL